MAEPKKDILISGASGVIGSTIARRLAFQGVTLHLTSRKLARLHPLKKELAHSGTRVMSYALDLSKPKQIDQAMRQFFKHAKNPYGLICNAGNLGALGHFLEVDFKAWSGSLNENFLAQAQMIRGFAQGMVRRHKRKGAIVVLSGGGVGGPPSFTHISSYRTAKAALTDFVETVAPELTPLGLTLNAISPGQVFSGLTETAIRAGRRRAGPYAESARKCKASGGVSPELTADVVAFLLGPKARALTGRLFSARFDREKLLRGIPDLAKNPNLYRLRRIDQELFSSR